MNRLKNIRENFKLGLRKIQRSEDSVKKRWLFSTSAILMLLIISLWFVYLNLALPVLAKKEDGQKNNNPQTENFFDTVSRGFQTVKEDFGQKFSTLKEGINQKLENLNNNVGQTNTFSIQNGTNTDFLPPTQEPVPKTLLP